VTEQPTLPEVGNDHLLKPREVAERLSVPEGWVREHARQGHVPHIKLGRYMRFVWADVAAWVEEQKAGGAPLRRDG
jgi:excisionase family DNA binding protein